MGGALEPGGGTRRRRARGLRCCSSGLWVEYAWRVCRRVALCALDHVHVRMWGSLLCALSLRESEPFESRVCGVAWHSVVAVPVGGAPVGNVNNR